MSDLANSQNCGVNSADSEPQYDCQKYETFLGQITEKFSAIVQGSNFLIFYTKDFHEKNQALDLEFNE